MKKVLEHRFKSLYEGERFAILLFIPIILINYGFPDLQLYSLPSFWVSFFLLEFILIQGAYYWHSKWKRLTTENKSITPIKTIKYLKRLKTINIYIIALFILLFFIELYFYDSFPPSKALLLSGFLFIFAVLEFVNYFYVQLAYFNSSDIRYLIKTKKLKRSSLNKELKRIP
ncbi:general stress protein [Oceanobacillus jeddahense]|uniref:General stress protein n=1 Tax=Oceanobacillus jeddahense TaxID=1462527 RepID=A0ABY5JUZ2_9BACI|nr:general stress protein [Oceanobacillus jeddahense]UUI04173.1 general stress protein [Oceanobacillus jeddahense]